MYKIKNSAIALAGLLLLAGAFAFVTPVTTQGQGQPSQSVNVVNTVSVRDVDNPARLAYQETAVASFSEGITATGISFSPVPAGKLLVIEHVSVDAELPIGQTARAEIITYLGGKTAKHSLVMNDQGVALATPTNREIFVASQLVRFYAGAGPVPGINVSRNGFGGGGVVSGTISGYLVDVP